LVLEKSGNELDSLTSVELLNEWVVCPMSYWSFFRSLARQITVSPFEKVLFHVTFKQLPKLLRFSSVRLPLEAPPTLLQHMLLAPRRSVTMVIDTVGMTAIVEDI
jgi:hypothetical protein